MGTGRALEQLWMLEHTGTSYSAAEPKELPDGFPCFAPPMMKFPDGLILAQTVAINSTLGKRLGLYPEGNADQAHALQVAFNGDVLKCKTKPEVVELCAEGARGDKWLKNFESVLSSAGTGFVVGGKLTYADFTVYNVIKTCSSYGVVLDRFPKLVAHQAMVSDLPKVKAFNERGIPVLPATMGPK